MKYLIVVILALMSLNIHAQDSKSNELALSGGLMTGCVYDM